MAFLLDPRALPRYIDLYGYAFSWKRLWNFTKVVSSMGVSKVIRRPVVWGKPVMMMVEPTNFCNLKCPLCPSGNGEMTRARGRMDLDDYKRLIDEISGHIVLLMLWNQGEPFLNPCFNEMVRYARSRRIPTLTSTNAHYIRNEEEASRIVESGLSEIIVSLDGVEQETYAKYRVGGRIERVFEGVRLLVQERDRLKAKTPLINLQFIVMKHNEDELEEAERIARSLLGPNDKFLVKTAQVYTDKQAEEFLPQNEEFRRYEQDGGGDMVVKGQPQRGCKVLWYSSMVNWNGAVAPCCFDKNVDFNMGDAFGDATFAQIWGDKAYKDFRRRILKDRTSVDMCRNCSEGYKGMFSLIKEIHSGGDDVVRQSR
jgi:radical SAM protein with 4Fe4S-binding SPASM domain